MKRFYLVIIVMFLCQGLAAQEFFVSTSGNDKNDGKSEGKAWRTIRYAASKASSGDIVWIKAGNYGNENVVINKSGKKGKPISFIGYKNKKGDIKSMYYSYSKGKKLDAKEMPLLQGSNRSRGIGIEFSKEEYIVIRNIQISDYEVGIFSSTGGNNIVDNIVGKSFGNPNDYSGRGIHLSGTKNELLNSLIVNSSASNVTIYGDNNLINNVKSYCDESLETGSKASTDYYITIRGNNNIIRNCHVERNGDLQHHGHGITLRGEDDRTKVENNLIENCKIINIKGALECRRLGVKNNTIRNVIIEKGPKSDAGQTGGIVIQGGASYNIFDGIKIDGTGEALRFNGNLNESSSTGGSYNVIKNSIFINVGKIIVGNLTTRKKIGVYNNVISNSVFYNVKTLVQSSVPINNSNEIVNCIISNVQDFETKSSKEPSNFKYSNNNFHNNGFGKLSGSGNTEEDPQFVNPGGQNFKLKSSSRLIDAGKNLKDVKKDYDGAKRPQGRAHDVGAYEYSGNSSNPVIKADAGKDQSVCPGVRVTLTASGGSNYLWSDGSSTKSIKVSPSETTTYEVKVSDGSTTASDEVTVFVEDVIADAGEDVIIERGDQITLNASGGGKYLWSSGQKTSKIKVNPSKTTTYSVTVFKNGCEDTSEVKVTVNQTIIPEVIAKAGSDQTICSGEEITLTASGGSTYLWSNGSTTKSIKVSPSETTLYDVKVSEGPSSDTDEVLVKVNEVNADAGSDVTIKAGEKVTLNASGGGKYLWSTGETTSSITVSPTKTSTYTVTTKRFGCEDTAEVKVTVKQVIIPEVIAKAGADQTICSGEEITLTASGGSTYLWSNGSTTKSIKVSPSETTLYDVKVSEGPSSDTDEVLVKVNEVNADAGSDVTIKAGEKVTLNASGGGKYLWSTGETTSSITVSPTKNSTYTVTVRKFGCEDTAEVKVTVEQTIIPTVVANAGEDRRICLGEEITLTATGGSTYLWSNGSTTKSIKVTPSENTVYNVKVTEGTTSDTDDVLVRVDNTVADAGSDVTIKAGEQITLNASGGGKYLWNTGETTSSITVSPTKNSTYTVTVRKFGCEDTAEVKVTVEQAVIPTVVANAGEDQRMCLGEEVTLTATGGSAYLWNNGSTTKSIKVSPSENTVYNVKVTEGTSSDTDDVLVRVDNTVADAGSDVTIKAGEQITLNASGGGKYLWNTGQTTSSITVSPTKTSTYTVTVRKFGCEDTAEVKVTVEQAVIPTVVANAGEDQRICLGEEITLTASGGSSYLWSNGSTTKSIKVSPTENTVYNVKVTEGTSSDTDQVLVKVNEVNADAGSDVTIKAGEEVSLNASGGGKYLWNTGETTSSITVSPTKSSTYTVTTMSFGCEDTAEVKVTVEQTIIPTVVANAGEDQRICLGEEITLTASGGSSYLWSNGSTTKSIKVTPSENTVYNVKVTEGTSSDSDDVFVRIDNIVADAGSDVTIKAGEEVTLNASGGGTYLWNTGETTSSITISPTKNSTYTVTVRKFGCEDTAEVKVRVEQAIIPTVIANAGEDQRICLGEEITLTATGGSTFLWNNGSTTRSIKVSPSENTVYNVKVTEGTFSDTDDVLVKVDNIVADAGSDVTIKAGEEVTLNASGGDNYNWNTGETTSSITVSPTKNSTYAVTVFKNGCEDTAEVNVIIEQLEAEDEPFVEVAAGEDITICLGESATLSASGNGDVLWSTGDLSSQVEVSPKRTTTYTVESIRGDDISSDDVTVFVENCSFENGKEVNEVVEDMEVIVYPVPSGGLINLDIRSVSSLLNLAIYDINGRLVYTDKFSPRYQSIDENLDLTNLPKGIYIIRLYNSNQNYTRKIILA